MSKKEKIRKPIKSARLKLWRRWLRKAGLHVDSGGVTGEFSSAKWRQSPPRPSSLGIDPPDQCPLHRQTGCEGHQAIP